MVAIGQPSLIVGLFEIGRHGARHMREERLHALGCLGRPLNALADGFARERQRVLADLLLAAREMEIERAAQRAAGGRNLSAARCHRPPAGGTILLPQRRFSILNQEFLPCEKISVANKYVDLHNM